MMTTEVFYEPEPEGTEESARDERISNESNITISEGWEDFKIAPRKAQLCEREIWVTFQKEGVHLYPAALTDPALADVSFLGYPHRHIFHFRVGVTVVHNDRDIEFILFKRELESLYSDGIMQMDHKSCEMLAEELGTYITDKYPYRKVVVGVSEDNENGATLTWI